MIRPALFAALLLAAGPAGADTIISYDYWSLHISGPAINISDYHDPSFSIGCSQDGLNIAVVPVRVAVTSLDLICEGGWIARLPTVSLNTVVLATREGGAETPFKVSRLIDEMSSGKKCTYSLSGNAAVQIVPQNFADAAKGLKAACAGRGWLR